MEDFGSSGEDAFNNSILLTTTIKNSNDLVDADLNNLLKYISKLEIPNLKELENRSVEFGELERQKTLIFDLDETLIHSQLISPDNKSDYDEIIELPN